MNQPQAPGSNGTQPNKRSRNRGRGGQNQRSGQQRTQRNRRPKLDRYVIAVVERTAAVARALALSADVLADPDD
jgi:hypothetical protein